MIIFHVEDGIRDDLVTGVQTCALPIYTCFYRECATRTNLAVAGGRRVGQAAARKAFVQDYKSVVRRYYSEIWNAWSEPEIGRASCRERVYRSVLYIADVRLW